MICIEIESPVSFVKCMQELPTVYAILLDGSDRFVTRVDEILMITLRSAEDVMLESHLKQYLLSQQFGFQ